MTEQLCTACKIAMECPEDPRLLAGQPIGMYHCPFCGEMQMAGMEHFKVCFEHAGEA